MKTTIGGDRLGSGNKQEISVRNYERSTHDLSSLWRSSMASGTLVPFMSLPALPGDSFDIELNTEVLTLPTVGPLFGSFKVQLDVFQIPIRLYQAELHMNKLGIGMEMDSIYLPQISVPAVVSHGKEQINTSCLLRYLGISGVGTIFSVLPAVQRKFNAIPYLGYWEIYKNYYSNKQEERGFAIHIDQAEVDARQAVTSARVYVNDVYNSDIYTNPMMFGGSAEYKIIYQFDPDARQPNWDDVELTINTVDTPITGTGQFSSYEWVPDEQQLIITGTFDPGADTWEVKAQSPPPKDGYDSYTPYLVEFPLENIDKERLNILRHADETPYIVGTTGGAPYKWITNGGVFTDDTVSPSVMFSQESLGIKTYQSDLFNNWISTEWIDGPNGVNEVTAVSTTGDSFTIDALNLANKVYVMLNRIAISGGTYDDWLDAVYTHERTRSIESPMYLGSLIKELSFQEVVSNADVLSDGGDIAPLGTLAGRGKLTGKHKGGKIKVKVDEPSYLMGIASITPRLDYSQGNQWDVNLKTMNDFHKPALDAIGFQDLITEQMHWESTKIEYDGIPATETLTFRSAGKQPAWINYMTDVNRCYGNFADINKEMFMTLNRRYETLKDVGTIEDLTTYIDPTKFNQIFADTNLDAQNFWVQISKKITARRKMSAKVIPNL